MDKNNININDIEDENGGDNRGKFSDRLKRIRRDRVKLQKKEIPNKENILITGSRNLFKIFLAIPSVIYSVIRDNDKKEAFKEMETNNIKTDDKLDINVDIVDRRDYIVNNVKSIKETRRIKVNKIREMNISTIKKKKEIEYKKREEGIVRTNAMPFVNTEKEERVVKLQKEIISLIKKQLVKNINEFEMLQSELFLIKIVTDDETYLQECQERIKDIKKMLSRINSLKEKYDYLKDNYDFEYMYEHGDEILIDKILELKDLCNSDDIKYVVDNYKILDEYKYLYLKIDKLQEDTNKYEKYKEQKEEEIKNRDINYEQLKLNVYNVEDVNKKYDSFVKKQEFFLKQLDENVSKIDLREKITYRLEGFNALVANSFKFMGLMLLNPFKAFIPGIAVNTLMTKNMICNLYDNLRWESKRKLIYEAIDYSLSINMAKNSLKDTLSLVDSTLEDIVKLKKDYQEKFAKYQYDVPGYRDTLKKINKMENAILGNRVKIELMQEKMKIKEHENKNKLERVKKLNSSSNNSNNNS